MIAKPTNKISRPIRTATRNVAMEAMEGRRLLAVMIGSQLFIKGTSRDDRVNVRASDSSYIVTQGGKKQSFPRAGVASIVANLRGGNDRIRIDWTVPVPTTLSGESGNDTIHASANDDAIFTGSGDDSVFGNAGNDTIQTSDGDDFIAPGFGNDTVDCGDGSDTVSYADRTTGIKMTMTMSFEPIFQSPNNVEYWKGHCGARVIGVDDLDINSDVETIDGTPAADILNYEGREAPYTYLTYKYYVLPSPRMNGLGGDDSLGITPDYDEYPYAVRAVDYVTADGGDGNDSFGTTSTCGVRGGDGYDSLYATDVREGGTPNYDSIESYSDDSRD